MLCFQCNPIYVAYYLQTCIQLGVFILRVDYCAGNEIMNITSSINHPCMQTI